MTNKRIAYGSFKNMTPEQQREHRLMLGARYRAKNRDKLREQNRQMWAQRKASKPVCLICKVCGKEFNAPRRIGYTRCDECRAAQQTKQHNQKDKQ